MNDSKRYNSDHYEPINCDFYDYFEIHAMRKSWVRLTIRKDEAKHNLLTKIQTLSTRDKSEYATLLDSSRIRLDHVEKLEAISPDGSLMGHLLQKLDYNNWANDEILKVLKGQPITKDIISAVSHICNALDIWVQRMNGGRSSYEVWQDHQPDEWPLLLRQAFLDIVDILNNKKLDSIIAYTTHEHTAYKSTVVDIMYHLINHSTYHRGQIITFLQQAGLPTVSTDFIKYSRSE